MYIDNISLFQLGRGERGGGGREWGGGCDPPGHEHDFCFCSGAIIAYIMQWIYIGMNQKAMLTKKKWFNSNWEILKKVVITVFEKPPRRIIGNAKA